MELVEQAFSIRRATVDDIEALVTLRLMLEREIDYLAREELADVRVATQQYFLEALPSEGMLIWVAEAAGTIVATSGLIFFQKPPSAHNLSGKEAYILNMYTLPEWRGRGIASTLLRTMLAFIRQTNARRIWMYATPDGRPVYEKAGFVLKTRGSSEMELLW